MTRSETTGWSLGPWWAHLSVAPAFNGWSFYVFRRRIAWRPIDYDQTTIVDGVRCWGLPHVRRLDLRKGARK